MIAILFSADASTELVWAVRFGCEEEGVPAVMAACEGDARSLANHASAQSGSFLGFGVDSCGSIALHDQRLGEFCALLEVADATLEHARAIGVAASRIVRGRPLEICGGVNG